MLSICVTVFLCGVTSGHSVSAELVCNVDGAFLHSGASPHKECIAGHIPEFADYSNLLNECKLKVYLTDGARKEALQDHLQSAYRSHVEQLPWCDQGREAIIEFGQVRHSYEQVIAWRAAAETAVRGNELGDVTSVLLCDAKLHVQVRSDAARSGLTKALRDLGIPDDAYVLGPDEPNVRGIPIIGLPSGRDQRGVGVSLPVSFGTDEMADELTLGLTDMRTATHILPPCPGHGPPEEQRRTPGSERRATHSDPQEETADSLHYAYIPAEASVQLGFSERGRLVALTYLSEKGQEELEELIAGISGVVPLQRIYADDRVVLLAGEAGSVLVTLGAERDWYDKPYRVSVSYAHVADPDLAN